MNNLFEDEVIIDSRSGQRIEVFVQFDAIDQKCYDIDLRYIMVTEDIGEPTAWMAYLAETMVQA